VAQPSGLYASAPGASDVAHATQDDYGMLLVRFPSGVQAFAELVGKPGLSPLVSIDRSSGRFMGVRFLNRPSPLRQQLAEALAAAARYGYRPPPLVYSSLRPYRPPVPPKPRGDYRARLAGWAERHYRSASWPQ
jgi:hypothetical protein